MSGGTVLGGTSKADWVRIEFLSSKTIYLKLPFDPFGEDGLPSLTGLLKIEDDVFTVIRVSAPGGQPMPMLIPLREHPAEAHNPPYLINLSTVALISRLSEGTEIYKNLQSQVTGLVTPRSDLIIPA